MNRIKYIAIKFIESFPLYQYKYENKRIKARCEKAIQSLDKSIENNLNNNAEIEAYKILLLKEQIEKGVPLKDCYMYDIKYPQCEISITKLSDIDMSKLTPRMAAFFMVQDEKFDNNIEFLKRIERISHDISYDELEFVYKMIKIIIGRD